MHHKIKILILINCTIEVNFGLQSMNYKVFEIQTAVCYAIFTNSIIQQIFIETTFVKIHFAGYFRI